MTGAVRYRVQVSTEADFSVNTFSIDTAIRRATPTAELPLGTLYWRVAGMDAANALGPWATVSFTKVLSTGPTPLYPAANATLSFPTDAVRFTWSAVPGAATYEFEVDDSRSFVGAVGYKGLKTTSFVLTEPRTSNQAFWWHVRGVSATTGVVSPWSTARMVTPVWAGTPTLVFPANAATIATQTQELYFDWDPVLGAKTYQLQVSPNQDWTNNSTIDLTVKGTRYAPPVPLNNGSYYWRVRALDAASPQNFGGWSAERVLTIGWGTRPTLIEPTDGNIIVSVPTFSWTPVDHASWYQLQISTDVNFASTNPPTQNCYTNRTTFTPYGPSAGIGMSRPRRLQRLPEPGIDVLLARPGHQRPGAQPWHRVQRRHAGPVVQHQQQRRLQLRLPALGPGLRRTRRRRHR